MADNSEPRADRAPEVQAEQVFTGLGVSPGIAIGVSHPYDAGNVNVPEIRLRTEQVAAELARFAEAVADSRRQITTLQDKARGLGGSAGEELGYMLDAYQQMLKSSRLVRGVERRIAEQRVNAEAAVHREVGQIVRDFAAMDDAYLAARTEDIREIGRRLVRHLTKTPYRPLATLPKNAVVLAEELTPADTALLDPDHVAGMATVLGGDTSHTAILARSLELPAVVGLTGVLGRLPGGVPVIVDGGAGRVIFNPTPDTLAHYRARRAEYLRLRRQLGRMPQLPSVTTDGVTIGLYANLELPGEIDNVLTARADGVGLLRSEFLYMNRDDLPGEEEQYKVFAGIVKKLEGRMLTIRTLDAGGDKLSLPQPVPGGPNPALGLRAIRLCLSRPELLEIQLAAILRAGALGPVRVLIPLVSMVEELAAVKAALASVAARLTAKGVKIADPLPSVGAMIEVPGAALAADALAREADFFAIGTNDLTQYTLAIDRGDDAVAHLYNPLHPAVLRLVQFAAEAAQRARIPVSVCGEVASMPRYTALLLGLGIRELSMAAVAIPRVKKRIRALDLKAATRRARVIMDQSDTARIAQLLDDFNEGRA